jgi:hypothetical protein
VRDERPFGATTAPAAFYRYSAAGGAGRRRLMHGPRAADAPALAYGCAYGPRWRVQQARMPSSRFERRGFCFLPRLSELDRIRSLDLQELRTRLGEGLSQPCAQDQSVLLVLGLAYGVQETEYGGLGNSIRRKLRTIAKALQTTRRVGPVPSFSLKPGARLGLTPK